MFSKLTLRSGALLPAWRAGAHIRNVALRASSGVATLEAEDSGMVSQEEIDAALADLKGVTTVMRGRIQQWQEVHDMYNSPERDYVNFPMVSVSEGTPRRLGVVPQQMLEPIIAITGMSGPYLIATGTILFLCNKQILLAHGDYTLNWAVFPLLWFFWNYYWKRMVMDKPKWKEAHASVLNAPFVEGRALDIATAKKQIEESKFTLQQEAGKKYMYEGYRENVELQLEEEYRRRMKKVHDAVVQRLEYQSAITRAKSKFETDHMIDYIIKGARASITPQQEKDMMAKCLSDLKILAQKQAKTA